MTKLYNKPHLKEIRRKLRQDQTFAEKNMWSQLLNRQFLGLKFKRQYSVDNYVIDFYCPEYKIAIELDGSIHELEEIKLYDQKRQKYIESLGINFIRVTNDEYLGNPNKTFEFIEQTINLIISDKDESHIDTP